MGLVASLLLLGGLWLVFGQAIDARDNPNRHLAVAPGETLVLKRGSHGHYIFPGEINGRPVVFLLDTGATLVSVPARLAEELNLQAGAYQNSITANGTVTTRATRIARLAFLTTPPDPNAHEVSDKATINRRAVIDNRKAQVEALYAEPPGPGVVVA